MKKMIIIGALTLFISLCAMAQEATVPAETTGGVMIDVTTFGSMMALVTMFVTELCKVVAYIDQHKWAKVLCSVGVGIAATMACWGLQVSDFLAGLVTGLDKGEAIMQSWAANGLTVPGANRAALEAVTTGEKGILIAGVDYNAYSSMAKGEPLKIYYPASGTVVNPRPAMILKTAPNMDNAKAFVDFLFSDEAQKLVADAYLLPGRSDVKCENRTNLDEIPQIPTDWDKMMGVASETADKLNNLCK